MASLTSAARALTRAVPRSSTAAAARCFSTTALRPDATSSYESPFKGERTTTSIPDFSKYASKAAPQKNLVYQYFMVGTFGAITAMGAKSTIQGKPHRHLFSADLLSSYRGDNSPQNNKRVRKS